VSTNTPKEENEKSIYIEREGKVLISKERMNPYIKIGNQPTCIIQWFEKDRIMI